MFLFLMDPLYLTVTIIGVVLSLIAQARVKGAFAKYSRIPVRSGMSGADAAAAVCRAGNVHDITIQRHQGFLSDHYDPRNKTLNLSPEVYDGRSISSIAVAAHEAGHAIQDVVEYPALGFRSALVPVANIGNRLWVLPFILGAVIGGMTPLGQLLMKSSVFLFGAVVLFQFVTLPVEFDASSRAKAVLAQTGIVSTQEEELGVQRVLGAAAMTYVAAAIAGLLQLVWLIMRVWGGSRD
jgi:Zn-dependent membrane protease YugP